MDETQETAATETIGKDERMWGMFAHLSALSGVVIPLGSIIGPLVIWLIKREEMPFVNDQGRESLNFQISVAIYAFVSGLCLLLLLGFVLLPAVLLFGVVMTIIAAVRANAGERYRYPLGIRFVK